MDVHGYSSTQPPHKAPFQAQNTPMDRMMRFCAREMTSMNSAFRGTRMACSVHGVLFKTTQQCVIRTLTNLHIEGMHMTVLRCLKGAFSRKYVHRSTQQWL